MRKVNPAVRSIAVAILLSAVLAAAARAETFPEVIRLPNGFQPEGIARGIGTEFFVGSLANGAVYKGDLRTGQGDILVPGEPGRVAVGLSFDERSGYLFVAGGVMGFAFVFDTRSGQEVGAFQLTGPGSFINDVVVTRSAAYFTDSFNPILYKLPLSANGALPDPSQVQTLPLGGDWTQVPGPFVFNANGIDATPDGRRLIVVNSTEGALYRVHPTTGHATRIDLGGQTVASGDGILLDGNTLYVVRNFLNLIAVVNLNPDLSAGQVTGTIASPGFRVPTTIAEFVDALYAVNARFNVTPGPDVEYEVVRVPKS